MTREEHDELKRLIDNGCLTNTLEPIKCSACKSEEMNDHSLAGDAGYISEFERRCSNCHKVLGYWAYGNWQV